MEITSNNYANSYTNYNGYVQYLNKDNLSSQMRQSNLLTQDEVKEENNKNFDLYLQRDEIDQEKAAAVYFNYQYVQSSHDQMEMLLESQQNNEEEEDTLTYNEIRDLQQQKNRTEVLDLYASQPPKEDASLVDIRV